MERLISHPAGNVDMEFVHGIPHLHLEFKGPWSLSTFKEGLKGVDQLRRDFGKKGHRWLYVTGLLSDKKLEHFHQMLGFQFYQVLINPISYERYRVSRVETVKEK